MKIQKLELRHFGKFRDRTILLGDGIQLLQGENEAGKTTIHTFIKSMLFGMERGRGRAAAVDTFSRYEPWDESGAYGGAIEFTCGGKTFRLERRFDRQGKRAGLVCLDDGEQLSLEDGDLEMILPGLEADSYEDTLYIRQSGAQTGQTLAAQLKNFAANYSVSGDARIDLAAAQEVLREQEKVLDRQARDRTRERQSRREKIEQEASYVWRDIHRLEEELERVREGLELKRAKEQNEKRESEKRMIDELRPDRWRIHPLEVAGIILAVVVLFVLMPRPWNYATSVVAALAGGIYIWNRMKVEKKRQKTAPELMLEEITPEEELASAEKLRWEQQHLEEEKKEKQTQYENLQEELAELGELDGIYKEQEKERAALALAQDRLSQVARDMQRQVRRDLNGAVSGIVQGITGGKYTRLLVEEGARLVFFQDGRRIPLSQVSRGTMEQAFLALRLASADLLYEEEYPLILDDALASYDDRRLANTLRWLAGNREQVLLFTCQHREGEILRRESIPFDRIDLP